MDHFTSNSLVREIEKSLRRAVQDVLGNFDHNYQLIDREIVKRVNTRMGSLANSLSFHFPVFSDINVKSVSFVPVVSKNGVIQGSIEVAYTPKPNVSKYGGPGYPGKENGQLCEYPKGSRKFYKWNEFLCRWEDVYKDIDRGYTEKSWYDKLTKNAAFEPWWGDNTTGGNYLKSDRKRNGTDQLWGDPGVKKPLGTFKKISSNVMKSIYNFTLNLKSAIGHYEKLKDAFGFKDEEEIDDGISNDSIPSGEDVKILIRIKKLNHWRYFMNNGHLDQAGSYTLKDSLIYLKDSSGVREFYKNNERRIKERAKDDFENRN